MRNQIIEKSPGFVGLTKERIDEIIQVIEAETGILVGEEIHRRFLYDPDKVWRIHFKVTYQDKPAVLCIENLKLEVTDESIRRAFRERAVGLQVRPPQTYVYREFDDVKGYAWWLEELVEGEPLFLQTTPPETAVQAFVPFFRELEQVARESFWSIENKDAEAFSASQLASWKKLAEERNPDILARHEKMLNRLADNIELGMKGRNLLFQHPHLAGPDVRVNSAGEYVLFANEFWSWRQPGYDLAFAIWNQWLGLEDPHRSHASVQHITDTWMTAIRDHLLSDRVDIDCVITMLFNRIFGSLILDLPAQLARHSMESVTALETALIMEAERLLNL